MTGHVSLVGAGPGDPELLTRRAATRLRQADLVLYDALVDERVLALARRAQRFFVGKRQGRHALSQDEINALMVRAARRGRRVVRLKGGDPFVFGRGGEEATALRQAGVPFDIVPGVSSAVAVPAAAGIPVTHRAVASGFLVVSGHDEDACLNAIGHTTPDAVSIVVLMGYTRRAAIAQALLAKGWRGDTPAALVGNGTRVPQHEWRGTLSALAAGDGVIEADAPVVMVIGAVAALDVRSTRVTLSPRAAAPARSARRSP